MNKFKVFFIEHNEVNPTNHIIEVDFKALDDSYMRKVNVAVEEKLKKDLINTGLIREDLENTKIEIKVEIEIQTNPQGSFRSPREHCGKCIYIYTNDEGYHFELEEIDDN